MQDKIIAAIAVKLNEYDTLVSLYDVEEMAQSIAAAIAPLVEAGEVDWKNAPEWANWVAQDERGLWAWFEDEPQILGDRWHNNDLCMSFDVKVPNWENSLQQRPK